MESATAAGWPAGMRTSEPAATEGFSNFRVGAGAAPQRCAAWILQRAAAGSQRFHVGEARPPQARAAILLPAMTFENPGMLALMALVGAVGLTLEHGLTDVTEEEAEVKRALIAGAGQVVAMIDHTKWGRVALSTFCPIQRVDLVITDAQAPAAMVAEVRARGIEVRTA